MQAAVKHSTPQFYIQPYTGEYKDGLRRLIPAIQQEFGIPITYEDQPDLQDIENAYCKGKGNFWVALQDGEVVGSIALIDVGDNIGVLRKMFVHKDHRGAEKGIGQALFDVLLAWCDAKGVNALYLGTNDKFQAARRFYEKNGFYEVEMLPDAIERIRMKVDNKHYCRRLAA